MNIEQLNSYINNKEPLDQNAISNIMQLIEKYPYFQTGHMLLLKAMHSAQPDKYNGQLKISASFISDKKKLYQYIHSEIVQIKSEPEKKEAQKIEKISEKKVSEKIPELNTDLDLKESVFKQKEIIEKVKTEDKIEFPVKEKGIETIHVTEKEKVDENKLETEKIKSPVIEKILEKEKKIETINLPEKEKTLEKITAEEVKRIPLKERLAEREKKLEALKLQDKEQKISKESEEEVLKSKKIEELEVKEKKIEEVDLKERKIEKIEVKEEKIEKIEVKEKKIEPIETSEPDKIIAKEVYQEKTDEFAKFEKLVEDYNKFDVFDDRTKKLEIKKKASELESLEGEQINQDTKTKHKKIVTDFFHTPVVEKAENSSIVKDEEVKTEKEKVEKPQIKKGDEEKSKIEKISDLIERKEIIIANDFPEFKEIKEERRRIFIPKKEPVISEEKKTKTEEQKIEENESVQEKEISKTIEKKTEQELISTKVKVEEPVNKLTAETNEEVSSTDTMNSIFSKIRQIKKEMNIESVQNRETIDVNPNVETSKIIRIKKGDDPKGGTKIIKESFIGFDESQIKKQDLIETTNPVIEKKESSIPEKVETEEIKTSGITAKDLFKQQLQNKEKTEESIKLPEIQTIETKSTLSKLSDKLNQVELKEEKIESILKDERIEEKKTEEPLKEIISTPKGEETAADALLRKIAEKKRQMHEEKEREEAEKLKEKDEPKVVVEEKIEVAEIKNQEEEIIQETKGESEQIQNTLTNEKDVVEISNEEKPKDLIDTFIEKVENLERLGTKESKLVGDISEKSTEESDEFMTETMADLFIKQKNYKKAIEIYNKLILKFPEKKTYFAIQIKKAESLIK